TQSLRPALRERISPAKPVRTRLTPKTRNDAIVVKFREGTRIRSRSGLLASDFANLTVSEKALRTRASLDESMVARQLAQANSLFTAGSKRRLARLFGRPEIDLENEREEGEHKGGEELADLNLYYRVLVQDATANQVESLIDELNSLDIVEVAYPE